VRSEQAILGVEKLRKQVDSLIVINNNKLREVYGNLGFKAGFSKADEVLATASRGIAEVITHHYTQNIDLKDAKTVLSNSGTAIMGSATATGENRAKEAIISALDSPLLNDNKISGAKNVLLLIVSGTTEITIDEIGEINDHIQTEAGFNANIIMGVGEDDTLGDAVAVTIIATGFNVEQQNEIVNTEPKKIIHSLDGEQKLVHDLSKDKTVTAFDFSAFEEISEIKEEKIVFTLEEEIEIPILEEPTFEIEMVPTSEFIKNIEVTFEIVSPEVSQDFYFSEPKVIEIKQEVIEMPVVKEEQITFSFDLPIVNKILETKVEDNNIVFDLSNETMNIEVNQPVQVVPMTELNKDGIVKYSLEEYMEIENDLADSKQSNTNTVQEPVAEELNITVKQLDTNSNFTTNYQEVSPMEMSIEETLKFRADERRRKLKDFNYKFHNNPSKVDEFEKEPAYKRSGIDLSNTQNNNSNSRFSLGTDSNDDIQLRSNNSFLHDNVD
jgi:cell division protein FtsZ